MVLYEHIVTLVALALWIYRGLLKAGKGFGKRLLIKVVKPVAC